MDFQELLSVSNDLRQMLVRRAVNTALIHEACSSFLHWLYCHRNIQVTTTHLILHFTTIYIKGNTRLGAILKNNAMSASVGVSLIDKLEARRKPASPSTPLPQNSIRLTSNDNSVVPADADRMETDSVSAAKAAKKKSRWQRFKIKLARDVTDPTSSLSSTYKARRIATAIQQGPDGYTPMGVPTCERLLTDEPRSRPIRPQQSEEEKLEEARKTRDGYLALEAIKQLKTVNNITETVEILHTARMIPLHIKFTGEMERQAPAIVVSTPPRTVTEPVREPWQAVLGKARKEKADAKRAAKHANRMKQQFQPYKQHVPTSNNIWDD